MHIIRLDSSHKGTKLTSRYDTAWHYRAVASHGADAFGVSFEKTPFATTQTRCFEGTLLEDWLENPRLFAAEEDGTHYGYIELSHESWNNRMRVSNLWVAEERRRDGIGRALMTRAVAEAREAGARGLVLETQSCNFPALCFYRAMGFVFTGCDLTAYHDDDVARGEVRLELALLFRDTDSVE